MRTILALLGIAMLATTPALAICWHGLGIQAVCQRAPGDYTVCAGSGTFCQIQLTSFEGLDVGGCGDTITIQRIEVTTFHDDGTDTVTENIMPANALSGKTPEATLLPGEVWAWPYPTSTKPGDTGQLHVFAEVYGYDEVGGFRHPFVLPYGGAADIIDCPK